MLMETDESLVEDQVIEGQPEDKLDDTIQAEADAVESLDESSDTEPQQEQPEEDDADSEHDLLIEIWNAEMRCRGKEAVVEDLKEQLKDAKAEYEDSVVALRKLCSRTSQPMPLFDKPKAASKAEEPEYEDLPPDHEPWMDLSFADFLDKVQIEGMGPSKRDALLDMVKTFGEFQELRVKASLDGIPLRDALPKGFGEAITDRLEEAFLNAIPSKQGEEVPLIDDL